MKLPSLLLKSACAAAIIACGSSAANAAYPAPYGFDGYYSFIAADCDIDPEYAGVLSSEFEFFITTGEGVDVKTQEVYYFYQVKDFLMAGSVFNASYDEETGVLALMSNTLQIGESSIYLGLAPADGGWTGLGSLNGNMLKFQVGEDGSVTIPPFSLITFEGATQTGVVASYADITVKSTQAPEPEEPGEIKNFEGTYPVVGLKYEYPDGVDAEPVISEFNFDVVINSNNQITSIAGYTLDEEEIANGRNEGVAVGDELVLEAAMFNGVKWEMVGQTDEEPGFMESLLFGGPDIYEWDQLSPTNRLVFTLSDDGTYSLSTFTLWYRHQIENASGNNEIVRDLVFKWEETEPGHVEAGVAGIEAADNAPEVIYNLQGVRVNGDNLRPGIYIINGKKVAIR